MGGWVRRIQLVNVSEERYLSVKCRLIDQEERQLRHIDI